MSWWLWVLIVLTVMGLASTIANVALLLTRDDADAASKAALEWGAIGSGIFTAMCLVLTATGVALSKSGAGASPRRTWRTNSAQLAALSSALAS